MKIWVRGTAVPDGQERQKTLCCLHSFIQKSLIFKLFLSGQWALAENHCSLIHIRPILSMRPGTFHHTPRGISKPPERRVQQRGLFVSSSATAPVGFGRHCCHFFLLPVVTRDIPWGWHGTYPPRQGVTEMGERTDMCSSYTEQQLGKQEVMGLNTALTPWLPRSGLAFLNNWQNHGAWYYREWKFFKKSLEQNENRMISYYPKYIICKSELVLNFTGWSVILNSKRLGGP